MPYAINSVDGELSEYTFDFGGVLALRNFTARTDKDRIIIQHAEDSSFALLDALVSEVEINGVVYDNPADAQAALQRLVFSGYPLTVIEKDRLKKLISVDKQSFTEAQQAQGRANLMVLSTKETEEKIQTMLQEEAPDIDYVSIYNEN